MNVLAGRIRSALHDQSSRVYDVSPTALLGEAAEALDAAEWALYGLQVRVGHGEDCNDHTECRAARVWLERHADLNFSDPERCACGVVSRGLVNGECANCRDLNSAQRCDVCGWRIEGDGQEHLRQMELDHAHAVALASRSWQSLIVRSADPDFCYVCESKSSNWHAQWCRRPADRTS